MKYQDAINIEDLRQIAQKRLPRFVFSYVDGGSGDERTLAAVLPVDETDEFLAAAVAFDMVPLAAKSLVLQMLMPVAVTSYLMAERYDAEPVAVAELVVVSTVLAVAVTPLVLGFMLG